MHRPSLEILLRRNIPAFTRYRVPGNTKMKPYAPSRILPSCNLTHHMALSCRHGTSFTVPRQPRYIVQHRKFESRCIAQGTAEPHVVGLVRSPGTRNGFRKL